MVLLMPPSCGRASAGGVFSVHDVEASLSRIRDLHMVQAGRYRPRRERLAWSRLVPQAPVLGAPFPDALTPISHLRWQLVERLT